jgi:hypothetical protein
MPRQQLRLVFSRSMRPSSPHLKMSLCSSPKRSTPRKDSAFIGKMRTLERLSPDYASVLEGLGDTVIAQLLGAPLE